MPFRIFDLKDGWDFAKVDSIFKSDILLLWVPPLRSQGQASYSRLVQKEQLPSSSHPEIQILTPFAADFKHNHTFSQEKEPKVSLMEARLKDLGKD